MAVPDAWQKPAADDIDSDALEYLFDPQKGRGTDVPWVRVAREPEPVARISPEIIRLQAKMELLIGQLDLISGQLKSAHVELGFLKAQLADKDEQLQTMSEYRARAALAIVADVEREQLRARVSELEEELAQFAGRSKPVSAPVAVEPATAYLKRTQGRIPLTKQLDMPLMHVTYVLMLLFAMAVLVTIFM